MDFKVGNKVRLKTNLKENENYGGLTLYPKMIELIDGLETKIICETQDGYYRLEKTPYAYSSEMLQLCNSDFYYEKPYHDEVEKVIVNNKTVIVILKSGEKGVAKCCEGDTFVYKVGYDIAYHRAMIKMHNKKLKKILYIY